MTMLTLRRWTVCLAAILLAAACSSDNGASSELSDTSATSAASQASASTATAAPATSTSTSTDPSTTRATTATTAAPTTTTQVSPTVGEPALTGPLTVQQLLDLGRPIVLAHAAGEDQFPHSSPYGYGESVMAGVDMLDLDVQLTADGVLIVHHDDGTGRTADADLVVGTSTYEQLHALDNAYWFTAGCVCKDQPAEAYIYRGIRTGAVAPPAGFTPDDFAIARFRDIAERFPAFPVNIEIKGTGAPAIAAAQQLAVELTELDLLDNAVVASFDDAVVAAFHGFAPTVEISPGLGISTEWVLNSTPLPDGMRILQLPPKFGDIDVLSAATMTKTHAAGYAVWVWPNDRALETAEGYRGLLEQGMDGLNVNFPGLGVEAVKAFTGVPPTS